MNLEEMPFGDFKPSDKAVDASKKQNMQALDAPMPGQSLTRQLGAADYERPPKFTKIEQVTEYVFGKLASPEVQVDLFNLVDAGVPISLMVEPILLNMSRKGLMNVDMATLAAEPVAFLIAAVAKQAGLNPVLAPEKEIRPTITDSQYKMIKKSFTRNDGKEEIQESKEKVRKSGLLTKV
jgi:hypothetical protein